MKKSRFCILLFSIIVLYMFPSFASEDGLSVIRIINAPEKVLIQDQDVPVKVQVDETNTFEAVLRQYSGSNDIIESSLPQKSLEIESEEVCFTLYNDGYDARNTKIVSTVCCSLIEQSGMAVPLRMQEPVIVYLNDAYWGLYTRREHIEDAIARFEKVDDTANINVADANCHIVFGETSELEADIMVLKSLDLSSEEDREIQQNLWDAESFLKCLAINAYFGNSNLYGSVFLYQINGGPWKCAMGDFTYSFGSSQDNSIARYVSYENGSTPTGNIAVIAERLLKVPVYREMFLNQMGKLYQILTVPLMQNCVDEAKMRIAEALPKQDERWASDFILVNDGDTRFPANDVSEAKIFHSYCVFRLRDKTIPRRPWYIYDSVQRELQVSDEDMNYYFGSAKPSLPEVPTDDWASYKRNDS